MQVSTLLALMQDFTVDMLLLDLRDEEAYTQFHLKGGESCSCISSSNLLHDVRLLHLISCCVARGLPVGHQSHSQKCAAAVNYPIRLLSRQCNPFTTEILAYVNGGPQKIIVLSDLDEHMAFTAGNSFYEKGVDNVFIVSGGALKSAVLPAFQHWYKPEQA